MRRGLVPAVAGVRAALVLTGVSTAAAVAARGFSGDGRPDIVLASVANLLGAAFPPPAAL